MGYTRESRNYSRLIAATAADVNNPDAGVNRGLASDLYTDLLKDGNFDLIWHDAGGDVTNLWKAKNVIFQPSLSVDPLAVSQPYRIGFSVSGDDGGKAGDGNELRMWIGTKTTLTDMGILKDYSYPVVLVEGGDNAFETRIGISNEHAYRVTITDRGFVVLCWSPLYIEDMRFMGMGCVQRPVKCDGSALVDGYAPVFAIHNTDPMNKSRPRQSDKFYRALIREKDQNLPQLPSTKKMLDMYRATGTISIYNPDKAAQASGPHSTWFGLNLNGADVRFGPFTETDPCGGTGWFGGGDLGRTWYGKNNYFSPDQNGAVAAATVMANALNNSTDMRIREATYVAAGNNVHIIYNKPGTKGNNFAFAVSPNNWDLKITPTVGHLSGGGGGRLPSSATMTFSTSTNVDTTTQITVGTGAGVTLTFAAVPNTPTQIEWSNDPAPVTASDNNGTNMMRLYYKLLELSTNPSYPEIQNVNFSFDYPSRRIFVDDGQNNLGNKFKFAASGAGVTATGALGGGVSNQASNSVSFYGLPNPNSIVRFNGVDFRFVLGSTIANNEITMGTATALRSIKDVLDDLIYKLNHHPSSAVQRAAYGVTYTGLTGGFTARIDVIYRTPGIEGNDYTLYSDSSMVVFGGGIQGTTTLVGGCGFIDTDDLRGMPGELSELSGVYGDTMFRFPNKWEGPVTTDEGDYVLVFPFGICSDKVAFNEEMDLIAVSKGPAYQGVQAVNINVYNQPRTYTSYCSNFATENDYVRIFVLTGGGGI